MAERVVNRRLVVTAQQSGVREVARDVESLGQSVTNAAKVSADGSRSFGRSASMMAASGKNIGSGVEKFAGEIQRANPYLQEMTKLTLSQSRAFSSLEKSLDPAFRNLQRYQVAEEKIAAGVANRAFSIDRGNELLGLAAVKYRQLGDQASGANDNIRLSSHQMLNLSRQGQDVVTMLALGAPAMQVFASQASQVYDAISSGPGGLTGGLKGLAGSAGSAIVAVGPLGLALSGLVAGVGAYAYSIRKDFPDLTQTIEEQEKALAAIEKRYGSLSDSVSNLGDRFAPTSIIAGRALRDLQMLQREQQLVLERQLSAASGIGGVGMTVTASGAAEAGIDLSGERAPTSSRFAKIRETVDEFRETLQAGKGDILGFYAEIDRLYGRAGDDKEMMKAIETAQKYGETLFDITIRTKQLQAAIWESNNGVARYRDTMKTLDDAMSGMRSIVPDMRTDAQKIEENYQVAMRSARTEAQVTAATDARSAALGELAAIEERRRQGYALDLQAVTARTVAERAAIAGAQAFNEALGDPSLDDHARRLRQSEAETLVFAQATQQARDALLSANDALAGAGLRGYAQQLAQINAEISRQTELNPQNADTWQQVGEARRRALEISTDQSLFDPLQDRVEELKAQAAAIGLNADATRSLTDAMKAEQTLREAGIDPLSDRADQYRRAAAAVSDYAAEVTKLSSAWDVVHKAEADAIDKGIDAIMSGDWKAGLTSILDDLKKQIVEIGIKNPLKNALTGSQLPTISDLFLDPQAPTAPLPQLTSSMNVNAAVVNIGGAGVAAALGAAPLGDIERGGALAAVNKLAGVNNNGTVPPVSDMTAYIRQASVVRGIDPEIALRVARSEGLGEGIWQSNYRRGSYREPSFGPFQLLKGGPGTGFGQGLGNAFMRDTGFDPADPRSTYAGIDYALNHAAKNGWGAWYGADKAGVGRWDGLRGAQTAPIQQVQAQIQQSATALQQSAQTLAPAASQFTAGLGQQLNGTILNGVGQVADQFVPGFGGVLQQLLQQMGQAGQGGGFGWVGNILGGGGDPWGGLRMAKGGAFMRGISSHSNTVVDQPTIFAFASGTGLMGEAGPEAIMPLSRGADGKLGVTLQMPRMNAQANSGGGGPRTIINFSNPAGYREEVEERTDPNGDKVYEVMIRRVTNDEVTRRSTKTNRSLRAGGLKIPVTSR